MSRPLGKTQQAVLEALKRAGGWSELSGWHWGGAGATERVLDTLVRRGLVERRELTSPSGWKYPRYVPIK